MNGTLILITDTEHEAQNDTHISKVTHARFIVYMEKVHTHRYGSIHTAS